MATNRFLVVAKYAVGSNRGLRDIQLVDTRVRGGGIKESLIEEYKAAYPQVKWFWDIGHYDGTPFPGAAAVLIDIPASILEENGGDLTKEQIDSIVKHHLSFGVYPIIRFYCTNTGLVLHESTTGWDVDEGLKCPNEDGLVICTKATTTTTTTTTTTGPLCSGAIYSENFADLGDWSETDVNDIAAPGPNGYEHADHDGNSYADVQFAYSVGDNFDICVEVDITEISAGITDGTTSFIFNIFEALKGGGDASIMITGNGAGGMKYSLYSIGSWTNGDDFGTITAPSTHFLRFVRTDTTLKAYVWNEITKQWEWNGNPAGATDSESWTVPVETLLEWYDEDANSDDYVEGSIKAYSVNAGSVS